MELTQLMYFKAVAECNNMSRAAEALHITQPALSIALSKLEAELGVPLFDRKKNKVTLNDAGEQALASVDRILAEVDLLKQTLTPYSRLDTLSVASCSRGNLRYFSSFFLQQFPSIMLETHIVSDEETDALLAEDQYDFIFTYHPIDKPGCVSIPLGREPVLMVIPNRSPLAKLPQIPLSALDGKEILLLNVSDSPLTKNLEKAIKNAGVTPKTTYINDPFVFSRYFTQDTPHIMFISAIATQYREIRRHQLIPIAQSPLCFDLYLSFREDRRPALEPLLSGIRRQYTAILEPPATPIQPE